MTAAVFVDTNVLIYSEDGAQPVPGMPDQIDGRTSHGIR